MFYFGSFKQGYRIDRHAALLVVGHRLGQSCGNIRNRLLKVRSLFVRWLKVTLHLGASFAESFGVGRASGSPDQNVCLPNLPQS